MSDNADKAPERIWATHDLRLGYYFTAKGPQPRFDDVEYIRADIHAAEISALQARNAALVEALEWYAEQSRLARLIHSEGDAGRYAIQNDGGKKARAAIEAARGE